MPTSVVAGRGLDTLKSTLARELSMAPPPRDIAKPRLAVDRVFTLQGAGTVVTGTLSGGTLHRGQAVVIQPDGHSARIRRIQSHGRDIEVSGPGTRTALNLTDVNPVHGVHRGDVISPRDAGAASDCVDVMLEISPRASRPMKDGVRVRVHYGSGNVPAHVALGIGKDLPVGQRGSRSCASIPVYCGWRPSHRATGPTADSGGGRRARSLAYAVVSRRGPAAVAQRVAGRLDAPRTSRGGSPVTLRFTARERS